MTSDQSPDDRKPERVQRRDLSRILDELLDRSVIKPTAGAKISVTIAVSKQGAGSHALTKTVEIEA
jgi:hypothetical protein